MAYIDIYPLDGLIEDGIKRKIQFLFKDYYFYMGNVYYANLKIEGKLKRFVFKIMHKISRVYKYEIILDRYKAWCCRYNDDAEKIGLVYHSVLWKKYNFKKDYVMEIIEGDFEGYKVPIPRDYDALLREVYGEYMKFPPVEERGMWHNDMIIYDPEISYIDYIKMNS